MNLMLVSSGYPWTVIPVAEREEYMRALDRASVHQDLAPFTALIVEAMRRGVEATPGSTSEGEA